MPEESKISQEQIEQALKIEAMKKSYAACFSGKSGKVVMDDLERKCFYHSSTMSKDLATLAFREGQRAVVLHVKTMMNFSLDRIKKIAQQQESEE